MTDDLAGRGESRARSPGMPCGKTAIVPSDARMPLESGRAITKMQTYSGFMPRPTSPQTCLAGNSGIGRHLLVRPAPPHPEPIKSDRSSHPRLSNRGVTWITLNLDRSKSLGQISTPKTLDVTLRCKKYPDPRSKSADATTRRTIGHGPGPALSRPAANATPALPITTISGRKRRRHSAMQDRHPRAAPDARANNPATGNDDDARE